MSNVLARYLDTGALFPGVEAASAEAVITLLAGALERAGRVKPGYREAVLAREAELPTGLPMGEGRGVAIPHTDREHVLRPGVAVARLAAPVVFRNMEDPDSPVPVRFVFALALSDKDQQIEMLQAVLQLMQDDAAVRAMEAAGDAEALAAAILAARLETP